ncbi:MAG: LpxI family protein, partial [Paracoccaceae bacterium]
MSPLTALIAGSGALPALLVAERPDLLVTALDGFLPQGLQAKIIFRVERLVPFMRALEDLGVQEVIFAGSVRRPRLDPSLFDAQTAQIVPQLVAAMQGGDDTIVREVVAIFENFGFVVKGLKDVAPAFLPSAA